MIIKNKKLRFGAVGVVNTLIDFGLFFLLKIIGFPTVSANLVGSTAAFITSFVLNKKVTFQTRGTNLKREVLLFLVITLFGLWVIQTLIVLSFEFLFASLLTTYVALFIGKVVATCITLIWNYIMYSRVVFRDS